MSVARFEQIQKDYDNLLIFLADDIREFYSKLNVYLPVANKLKEQELLATYKKKLKSTLNYSDIQKLKPYLEQLRLLLLSILIAMEKPYSEDKDFKELINPDSVQLSSGSEIVELFCRYQLWIQKLLTEFNSYAINSFSL